MQHIITNIKINKFNIILIGQKIFILILILSLTLPTIVVKIKITLLIVLLLFTVVFALKNKKIDINNEIFLITLFFITLGLIYSFYGVVVDNPGAISTVTVMNIYPLLFLLFSIYFSHIDDFNQIKKAFILGSFFVVLVQMSFLLSAYGVFPKFIANFFTELHPGMAVLHVMESSFLFTLPNVSSLMFMIPFLTASILLSKKIEIRNLILVLVMLILILLTGRRAFFLAYGFSLIFLIFIALYLRKNLEAKFFRKLNTIVVFFTIFFICFITFTEVNIQMYIEIIYSIIDFSSNDSNLKRVYQFIALYEGIANLPLFGAGPGAVVDYPLASKGSWGYELSYVAFMFHYGIFGFLVYLLGIVYIFISLLKICKDEMVSIDIKIFIISFLAGLVSFLAANATNPYLGKFDYMWVIFIPVMIINAYKVEKRKQLAKDI